MIKNALFTSALACVLVSLAGCEQSAESGLLEKCLSNLDSNASSQTRGLLGPRRARLRDAGAESAPGTEIAQAAGKLGMAWHAIEYVSQADACYRLAAEQDPEDYRWPYLRSHVLRARGLYTDANESLAIAGELSPSYTPTRYWRGMNALETGDWILARSQFEKTSELHPDFAGAWIGLARIALIERDYSGSIAFARKALVLQPQVTEAHYLLGQAFRELGDLDMAQRHFERIPHKDAEHFVTRIPDPLLNQVMKDLDTANENTRQGNRAAAKGQWLSALAAFEQALKIDPHHPDHRYNFAAVLAKAGRPDEALAQLDDLLETHPDHARGHLLAANLHDRAGRHGPARTAFEAAIQADPGLFPARMSWAQYLQRNGSFELALEQFRLARELRPYARQPRLGFSQCLLQRRQWELAMASLEEDMQALPQNQALSVLYSRLLAASPLAHQRSGARALGILRASLAPNPTITEAETLAMAYAESGLYEDAVSWQASANRTISGFSPVPLFMKRRLQAYRDETAWRIPWSKGEIRRLARVRAPRKDAPNRTELGAPVLPDPTVDND